MSEDMKYLVVSDLFYGPFPVIFPNRIPHDVMAGSLLENKNRTILSAGFISFSDKTSIACYGESISLKLKSSPDDKHIIERDMNLNRYDNW